MSKMIWFGFKKDDVHNFEATFKEIRDFILLITGNVYIEVKEEDLK